MKKTKNHEGSENSEIAVQSWRKIMTSRFMLCVPKIDLHEKTNLQCKLALYLHINIQYSDTTATLCPIHPPPQAKMLSQERRTFSSKVWCHQVCKKEQYKSR